MILDILSETGIFGYRIAKETGTYGVNNIFPHEPIDFEQNLYIPEVYTVYWVLHCIKAFKHKKYKYGIKLYILSKV